MLRQVATTIELTNRGRGLVEITPH